MKKLLLAASLSGARNPARMDIVRVDRPHAPQRIDRGAPWPVNSPREDGASSGAFQQADREVVTTASPPPTPRVVAPRS